MTVHFQLFEFRHKWLFNHFTCDFDYAIQNTLQNDGTKQNTGDETRCEPIGMSVIGPLCYSNDHKLDI
jgi:hypothetical protein